MTVVSTPKRSRIIAGAALLSLGGLLFHNFWDLPKLSLLSPENSGPTLAFALLFGAWLYRPHARATNLLLLFWSCLHLIGGGIISVIPFAFLPFYPEQSWHHYFAHVVYSVTQVPLMVLTIRRLRGGH